MTSHRLGQHGRWFLTCCGASLLMACGGTGEPLPTGVNSTTAVVSAMAAVPPAKAYAGAKTSFAVTGNYLPLTTVVTLADGTCSVPINNTASGFTVDCTAGTAGNKIATFYSNTPAPSGNGYWLGMLTIPIAANPAAVGISLLTDTGVTSSQCYAAGIDALAKCDTTASIDLNDKQDGMTGRDAVSSDSTDGLLGMSYSAIGSDCVKDNVTGLVWQTGTTTLLTLPGDSQNQEASTARSTANGTSSLCGNAGYTDWRLPLPGELQSLLNYGLSLAPVIDPIFFRSAKNAWYITGSPYRGGSSADVWVVDFGKGSVKGIGAVTGSVELRLVRGTALVAQPRYTYANATDGSEVTDAQTGLTWSRCPAGQSWSATTFTCNGTQNTYTHENALRYAKGQPGWRLPNVKELASLADVTQINPAINATAFPGTLSSAYWSSTPDVSNPLSAWTVSFDLGSVNSVSRNTASYVRLIR